MKAAEERRQVLADLEERFRDAIVAIREHSPKRVYIEIRPEGLREVADYIFHTLEARFSIASAVDTPEAIEILYHFILERINLLISLRVKLDREMPEVDSLAVCFPAAEWIEREIHELFGVQFRDHPDLRRLLLPEQWPEGVYPLRRDYREWDPAAVRTRGV
ncbi:MAG: hypothetical protein Kow00109_05040 [Acidobacteriota bacterium]